MKTDIDLKNYHFINLPKPLKEFDYQEVCDLVVSRLKSNPAIKSIYLSGGPWKPGISDLDILVIFHDQAAKDEYISFSGHLSEKAKFLVLHNYGKYNEEYFKNLCYLVPDKNKTKIKLLYGKEIPLHFPVKELNQNDYKFLYAIIIFDFLINKLLFYPKYLMEQKIDVRKRLGLLYSLTYTLEVIELLNGVKIGQDFYLRIKKLRANWFENNEQENLKELISLSEKSVGVVLEIVAGLTEFVKNNSLPEDKNIVFKNRQYYIIFDENWDKDNFLKSFKDGYIGIKNPFSGRLAENFKLILPSPLSYFLISYANYDGILSKWIRKDLDYYKKITLSANQGIDKHIKIANEFVEESVNRNGLFKIPFSYGYLIKKQRLISRIGDCLVWLLRMLKN